MPSAGTVSTYLSGLSITSWGTCIIGDELYIGKYGGGTILVYSLNTKALLRTITLAFSYGLGTDGTNLMVNTGSDIKLIDKTTGATIGTKNIDVGTYGGSFRVDLARNLVYFGNYSNALIIKDWTTGSTVKTYTITASVSGVDLIAGNYLVVSSYSSNRLFLSAKIEDINNLTFTLQYTAPSDIVGVAYYPSNKNIYLATYNTTMLNALISGVEEFTTDVQEITTPSVDTSGRSGIVGVSVVDSSVAVSDVPQTFNMNDLGTLGSGKLWQYSINKRWTGIGVN